MWGIFGRYRREVSTAVILNRQYTNERRRNSTRLPSLSCPPVYDYRVSTIVLGVVQHEENFYADLHQEEVAMHDIRAELEGIEGDGGGEGIWVRFPVRYPEKVKSVRSTLHKNRQARLVGSSRFLTY